ncbi:GntR family transcriptional regulator [Desulfoluna limicola]|uniref:GntR family transcriptional regulator n=1 Tax=Desulfoluna limicola TaxID=2810562 RepID=A0ABM7PLF4_9BACT|nr:FadR/GntR family transcriptional regulator [Desulfoluna limicola]BCS98100.1 GntR family transcriptional regulator [Desulfoluna limicola]
MNSHLAPIKPKRVSDQVFEQIRELIFRGELKPGDKIMPERELMKELGVSRNSVREALNKLVAMGLVDQRQGQGTFVRELGSVRDNPIMDLMSSHNATITDLLEVRMGLECNGAALAAEKATLEDIRTMEKSIATMETAISEGRVGTDEDAHFHMAIAHATRNPLQVHMMKFFYDFIFYGINESLKRFFDMPTRTEVILSQHRQILSAIEQRKSGDAYAAMAEHIRYIKDFFENTKEGNMPAMK